MHIFDISIPDKPLTNIELPAYARELEIPYFRGVFMRDTLPPFPLNQLSWLSLGMLLSKQDRYNLL